MFVHPHPDDESISCGGTIARHVDEGAHVVVVTCTGGEEGENLAGIDLGDVAMPEVRRHELAGALAALGVREHEFLGYRDSGMAGTAANDHPESLHAADPEEAARRLALLIRSHRPDVVVSDDERGSYGHPDHIRAHEVTTRAIEIAADAADHLPGEPWGVRKRYVHAIPREGVLQFHERMLAAGLPSPFGDEPIEGVEEIPFGVPESTITTAIDVGPWYGRKRAAMRAHRSQIGDESFFLNLPDDLAREVFALEHYVLLSAAAEVDRVGVEDDLLQGLR